MKKWISMLILLMLLLMLAACTTSTASDPLDPDKPITVTVWHYYNGNVKESFDALVAEFNETVGVERGVVVDAKSQGDVSQLATAVFDAANESIGSSPMPDIFASYADNALRVNQLVGLVSMDQYFTEEEISAFRKEFLEEGKFTDGEQYYIVPIAKSFENLYVNKTYWEPFAQEHGYTNEDLATWEGLNEVAKAYYEETGRSFFGLDANANYMLVANMQLGTELYDYAKDGTATLNFTKENARMIWEYFYKPYINGYFMKSGRFSSDDAKTGSVLSYTGSTAGAAYFPVNVAFEDGEMINVEPLVLPYPYFRDGSAVAIQQGAGMCVAQSDEAHEYAAMLFLKWFTDIPQNLQFAINTGYFPVKNEALDPQKMLDRLSANDVQLEAIVESIKASNIMFENYTLYNSKPFEGSYEMRSLLDTNLITKINQDLATLQEKVAQGADRGKLISQLSSDASFEQWYSEMINEAGFILDKK
ncbi:MAG: putative lipoprotein [Firmicutes bacterium]|nr:putative lipoprotein [Bacillota bacterium]